MRSVVSDTTPIISLLKINRLDLLRQVYETLHIPQAVFHEIERGATMDFYTDLSRLPWIRIESIKDEMARRYFTDLDEGEAETIILASELHADLVLMDETLGRRHARKSGLKVSGTIGVLIKAKELGLIPEMLPLLLQMREQGVWIHERLIDAVKTRVNE